MNITQRTCANCRAFNPAPEGDEPACVNLVYFTEHPDTPQAAHRSPGPADRCDDHMTHAEDEAETHELELARQRKEATPEFLAAISACLRLVESLGQDHPDTVQALQRAMMLAPPSLHDCVARQAQEMGLIPEADGYTEDGQPVYSLEAIAAKLGIGMDEARQTMEAMLEDRAAMGLPAALVDPATVHRKH